MGLRGQEMTNTNFEVTGPAGKTSDRGFPVPLHYLYQ